MSGADPYEPTYKSEQGGSVSTDPKREEMSHRSRNEERVYRKELDVCKFLANHGFNIRHLSAGSVANGTYDILINGRKADIKCTEGASNIIKYAKKATQKQGAEIVVFRFEIRTPQIEEKIKELWRKGYKCLYYYRGESELHRINM